MYYGTSTCTCICTVHVCTMYMYVGVHVHVQYMCFQGFTVHACTCTRTMNFHLSPFLLLLYQCLIPPLWNRLQTYNPHLARRPQKGMPLFQRPLKRKTLVCGHIYTYTCVCIQYILYANEYLNIEEYCMERSYRSIPDGVLTAHTE